jgi:hypothetical protein
MSHLHLLLNLVRVHGALFTSVVDSGVFVKSPRVGQPDLLSKQHHQQGRHLIVCRLQARGQLGKVNIRFYPSLVVPNTRE